MQGKAAQVIEQLAAKRRVLVLGGMAVIAHGLSRTTEDADIWLEPMERISAWCDVVCSEVCGISGATFFDMSRRRRVEPRELPETIDLAGMVRVDGLDRYLDIFFQPHLLDVEDFEVAWKFAELGLGSARVLDESFLIATKTETGRKSDSEDVAFLESKLRGELSARLAVCDAAEARGLFARYLDHVTCQAALENADAGVREMGREGLRELAADGNPFAVAALKKLG